jgi:putative N6-adenine-specific DNA methylase
MEVGETGGLRLVATCARGLEEILAGELVDLGVDGIAPELGAVTFRGDWRDVWRANWRLRTANRVLLELATFNGHSGEALAAGARNLVRRRSRSWDGIDAGDLFHPDRTFALQATSRASEIRDTRWVVLKVKDGLVDGQRDRFGRRGSVARENPEVPLRVFLLKNQATVLLDTSGEPLDRRGYRTETAEAPLREHLAAACVLASGWNGRGPVLDPMCGSGTLLAEAGLWALGRPPGAVRRRLGRGWAFERLPGFDEQAFAAIRDEPVAAPAEGGARLRLFGNDRSPEALAAARGNLERAGLVERLELTRRDAFEIEAPGSNGVAEPGLVLINPPYGERLAESPEQWRRMGDWLKRGFAGWRAVVLAGGESRGKWIGLRPQRRWPVWNGPLEARLLVFDLY